MAKPQVVKVGLYVPREFASEKMLIDYTSDKKNLYGRILLNFRDYLVNCTKTFDKTYILTSSKNEKIFPYRAMEGLIKNVNRKEIDIAVQPFLQGKLSEEFVDFLYSFEMLFETFMTPMPEYEAQVLGILKTFSW